MLLIVGANTERLRSVQMLASRAQLELKTAASDAELAPLLAQSRRNILLVQEEDLDAAMAEFLARRADTLTLAVIVLPLARSDGKARAALGDIDAIQWLTPTATHDEIVDAVIALRDSMFQITRAELGKAFDAGEFVVQYQPKVVWIDEQTGWRTTEAEALVRLRHPRHGVIGPRHFIPEVEQFGFMERLSELVLETTLNQINRWQERDLTLTGCINLAPTMLDIKGLATRYSQLARQHGVECDRIIFEMPSAGVLKRAAQARGAAVTALREAGFQISLDDFGLAANCMQAFELLEFDEIKNSRLAHRRRSQ